MSPDFTTLNIYWTAKDSTNFDHIQMLLDESAYELRHELSKLRLMSHVPKIVFIKDRAQEILKKLEKLFESADYGPDYTPTTTKHDNLNRSFGFEQYPTKVSYFCVVTSLSLVKWNFTCT